MGSGKGTLEDTLDKLVPESLKGSPSWDISVDDFIPEAFKKKDKKKEVAPPPLAPELTVEPVAEIQEEVQEKKIDPRRRAMRRSRTIFTSPLGLSTKSNIAKKYLTGQ